MNLGIVGSRDFDNYLIFCDKVDAVRETHPEIDTIVSGGARGADSYAEKYAHENGLNLIVHQADWNKYGRAAGFKRNQLIWDDSDVIIAFWDGESKGTKHTIDKYKGTLYLIEYKKEMFPEDSW